MSRKYTYTGEHRGRCDVRIGAAVAHGMSQARKLSGVKLERVTTPGGNRKFRPRATGPRCANTYVSIEATCPSSCTFKGNGCYAQTGFTSKAVRLLDARGARGAARNVDQPMIDEAMAIDQLFVRGVPQDGGRDGTSGRDLRLHMSGDVTSKWGARILARAAERYQERGGGSVWSYTHRFMEVPREDWGPINVLASVENFKDAYRARLRGYAPAWTFAELPKGPARAGKAFKQPGVTLIPCPFEAREMTCVRCRLCLDHDLVDRAIGVAFSFHGPSSGKKQLRLPQVR